MKESRSGRLGGKRGCLCKDGTYSSKCCDGTLWSQGIGNISGESVDPDANKYTIQSCSDSTRRDIHLHTGTLTVDSVYFIRFQDNNYDGCYTVLSTTNTFGLHIKSATLYSDCTDCQSNNP